MYTIEQRVFRYNTSAKYIVCPKSNASDFFCAAQNGQERKVGVEAGGGGTQVYSWTFLS